MVNTPHFHWRGARVQLLDRELRPLLSLSQNVKFVVQLFSHVRLFATPWTATCQASLSFTISQSLIKLMSVESVMPSNHLILCCPLLLLPSIFPSFRVFSSESFLCIRWPKYCSSSFSISPSSEHSGLISFRMDAASQSAVLPRGTRLPMVTRINRDGEILDE